MKKYLYFLEQAQCFYEQHDLTVYEVALLDLVAKRSLSSKPFTVGELIRHAEIASQVTLHTAFKRLIAKKLLRTLNSEEDGRIKQVALTTLALRHYKSLDQLIVMLARNS